MWLPDLEARSGPLYRVIADALGEDVARGELDAGDRLPTHRDLAHSLGVTVGTVSRAYAEAERRGLVRGEVGRGTFVRRGAGGGLGEPVGLGDLGPTTGEAAAAIDLSANLPAEPPGDEAGMALAGALSELSREARLGRLLAYGPPAGASRHREAGSAWLARRGLEAPPERVLVTSGCQHAIAVLLATLTRPGDRVLAEELTYPGAKAVASLLHLRLEGLPMDRDGLLPEAFEREAEKGDVRVLYTVPTIHNPTGSVLPEERRRRIAEIARAHGVAVVEDDVHGLLVDDPPPPLAAFAPEISYHLAGTSKTLTPGLRVGYMLAPEGQVERIAAGIWTTAFMVPPLMAEIAARWIGDGTADRLLAARRREAEIRHALARRILGEGRTPAHPRGYHLWLALPEPWRADDFVAQARQRGVGVTPPSAFAVGRGAVPHAVRVCLGAVADRSRLEKALGILVDILDQPPEPCVCIA